MINNISLIHCLQLIKRKISNKFEFSVNWRDFKETQPTADQMDTIRLIFNLRDIEDMAEKCSLRLKKLINPKNSIQKYEFK